MDDPTLNKLAVDNMGHVQDKVMEYSTKPSAPIRKSRSNPATDKTQNRNTNSEVSPSSCRARILERKSKFRRSEPPSMSPQFLQKLNSKLNTGPAAVVVSDETTQKQTSLQKVVCVTHQEKFETVSEISHGDIQMSIDSSYSRHSVQSKSPSPENLDSSFDETSDEDVITDRVMGKDVEPEEEPSSPAPPIKPERTKKGTRGRSTVIVKSTAPSLSPVERRKNIQVLSDSFRPSSTSSTESTSSFSRSQTYTEISPRTDKTMQHQQTASPRTKHHFTSENENPRSTTQLLGGFVYLECEEVHIVCMYVCMYICMYVRMYVRTYVHTYVCICMHMCMCVCICICKWPPRTQY